ncbi:peptidoglycan-binding domain-containing protein [Actinomycetota bacterium Odt1-20B]
MMTFRHATVTAVLLATTALGLTACGGGSDDAGTARPSKTRAAAAQSGTGLGTKAQAARACSVRKVNERYYAGHYKGSSIVPSTVGDTSAGREAQCILQYLGYKPGTVDGVFGRNSQRAMRAFQNDVNERVTHKVLALDGLPGPKSWKYLRLDDRWW